MVKTCDNVTIERVTKEPAYLTSSKDWVKDMHQMQGHYGVHKVVNEMDPITLKQMLDFRIGMIQEEVDELFEAAGLAESPDVNPEEIVDAIIDMCVFAIGTLDLFGVDAHKAWEEVRRANMSKQVGIKEGRSNPLGLPDLCKPSGWLPPDHSGNHGRFAELT